MVNNTEKNEQEQQVHYPFGGFYRNLLPTAETSTTAPQTAQEAPIPAPADDALHTATEVTERAPRWVADVIGEDYKTWEKGHYAIDAGTGTGKTTFVLEQLLPWVRMRRKAGGKKILYLTLPRGICSCKSPAGCAALTFSVRFSPAHKSACSSSCGSWRK